MIFRHSSTTTSAARHTCRRRARRRRGGGRPAARHRRVPRAGALLGVTIEHVLETHTHADHVSGHGRSPPPRRDDPRQPGSPAPPRRTSRSTTAGAWHSATSSEAVHTPGHRPEHTAFVLFDTSRGEEPWAVLSGDSLFVGDVARPDLAVDKARARAGSSASARPALALPDETEVWPGAPRRVDVRRARMDMKSCSTIGFERRHNPLLSEDDEDRFVRARAGRPGSPAAELPPIVEINRGAEGGIATPPAPLSPRQVAERAAAGALSSTCARTSSSTRRTSPAPSASARCRPASAPSSRGWAPRADELVFVGRDDEDARVAAELAAAVGIVVPAGLLSGGMTSWRLDIATSRDRRLDVPGLRERRGARAGPPGARRPRGERMARAAHSRIAARPLSRHRRAPAGLDPALAVAVICGSGQRSAVGASLVQRLGALDVIHVVDGGVGTWARAGYEIEE